MITISTKISIILPGETPMLVIATFFGITFEYLVVISV